MSLIDGVVYVLVFLLGFLVSKAVEISITVTVSRESKDKLEETKSGLVDKLSTDDLPVGIIKRPDAKQWHKTHQDPTKQAADDAMRESLKDIPELNERR